MQLTDVGRPSRVVRPPFARWTLESLGGLLGRIGRRAGVRSVKEAMAVNLPVVAAPVGDRAVRLRGVTPSFVVPRTVER